MLEQPALANAVEDRHQHQLLALVPPKVTVGVARAGVDERLLATEGLDASVKTNLNGLIVGGWVGRIIDRLRHINRDPAKLVNQGLEALKVDQHEIIYLHIKQPTNGRFGKRGPPTRAKTQLTYTVRRVHPSLPARRVGNPQVTRNRKHAHPTAITLDPHEHHRIGARRIVAGTGIGAQEQNVQAGLAKSRGRFNLKRHGNCGLCRGRLVRRNRACGLAHGVGGRFSG